MVRVKLITGRTIEQGQNLENKLSEEYQKVVAVCELSEDDMKAVGVSEGNNVKVKTQFGEVVVVAKKADGNPQGIAFIPMGPWANAVVGGDTGGVGMPQFKGIDAEIERTSENVPSVRELLKSLGV
ncbi:molybdopterin dinucleotide binding domain-containing protein [Candidatus Alkanophaga liquidiphilum]|nr:Formylmethanofuran dehydrogenase subunit D [Candidatus Alkanophaga liquidiphilum]RLG37299.1 MAG: tRNA CCA-pyrophosphorylase [Candidatus Alkanophagales archaeon]